jgi:hypothetical protein
MPPPLSVPKNLRDYATTRSAPQEIELFETFWKGYFALSGVASFDTLRTENFNYFIKKAARRMFPNKSGPLKNQNHKGNGKLREPNLF